MSRWTRRGRGALESGRVALPIRLRSRAELSALLASRALAGTVTHLVVMHDDDCDVAPCRCCPEFLVEELTPATFLEGERLEREWRRSKVS